jgi:L-ascorbate metabolism protein UlaG (beta-lactamase superfamily)
MAPYHRPVPSVEYIGHGTVLVELDGVRLLTDPLLRKRVGHLRRAVPLGTPPRDLDAVLISHGHHDHLDPPSLGRLESSVTVVLPRGLTAVVPRRFGRVVEVVEGDELRFGNVTVRATHAEHDGGRAPSTEASALGFAILGSTRIFFAGDTDLFPALEGLVPDLDLALLPIWGWGPTLGRGKHLDPQRAVDAVRLLAPRIAVPIHWGTYHPIHIGLLHKPDYMWEPAEAFARAAAEAVPDVEVRLLQPGERLEL